MPRTAKIAEVQMEAIEALLGRTEQRLTLIHTAELHGVNAFHYLTALMRNTKAVAAEPASWLPWNYRKALAPHPAHDPLTPPPARAAHPALPN